MFSGSRSVEGGGGSCAITSSPGVMVLLGFVQGSPFTLTRPSLISFLT
jgi:hypothetical protein